MIEALRHRGPDHQAVCTAHGASIGTARLAILDPRPEGNQPMWNDDRSIVITYNGEIYNYAALREKEKFSCRTRTDTEVLLKLYERHGMDFLSRLRGMFAFGIYDTRTRTWHLARDSSGILPLFVAYPNGLLHFASETRALLRVLPARPPIDETALSHYLCLQYVPGPRTLLQGIEALPPGTLLTWQEGQEHRTIVQPHTPAPAFRLREEFARALPTLMDEAVRDHLIADRPLGIFLSGGMDSSVLLHHMSTHAAKPVRTFTVRFEATEEEDEARFNRDANLARLTARHYGTDHHEIVLTAEICQSIYRNTARALDQPNADSVAMAQYVLAAEAKKHVDVVLVGAGGDELFGGYPRYRVARILSALRPIPAIFRRAAARCLGYPPDVLAMSPGPVLAERLLARPVGEIQEYVRGGWFDDAATTELFEEAWDMACNLSTRPSPAFSSSESRRSGTNREVRGSLEENQNNPLRTFTLRPFGAAQGRQAQGEMLRHFMEFDRRLWLVDESLRLADATTLGHGLECRPPFLDPRIIAASLATPSAWHVTFRRTKALLKDAYRPLLPPHLFALDKASFYPPLAKWFRRECASLVEEALENRYIRERFDVEVIRSIFEVHRTKKKYALHTLASIVQLAAWFETVYDA